MRDMLALLLLELFLLSLFLRCGRSPGCCSSGSSWFSHKLCFCRRFLLLSNRPATRSFAGAGVGVSTLPTHGQIAPMTIAAIRADFDQPLDMHGLVFAEIALNPALGFDRLADAVDFVFAQVLYFLHS